MEPRAVEARTADAGAWDRSAMGAAYRWEDEEAWCAPKETWRAFMATWRAIKVWCAIKAWCAFMARHRRVGSPLHRSDR
jgi:hypothetical protein